MVRIFTVSLDGMKTFPIKGFLSLAMITRSEVNAYNKTPHQIGKRKQNKSCKFLLLFEQESSTLSDAQLISTKLTNNYIAAF